jgi:hypothetical protein
MALAYGVFLVRWLVYHYFSIILFSRATEVEGGVYPIIPEPIKTLLFLITNAFLEPRPAFVPASFAAMSN